MLHDQEPTQLTPRGFIGRLRLDRAALFSKPNSPAPNGDQGDSAGTVVWTKKINIQIAFNFKKKN